MAILNNSLVALLPSLDFENNYDYSTQATRPPFSQQLAVKVASNHLLPQVDLFTSLKQTGWDSSFDRKKGHLFALLEHHQQWAMLQGLIGEEIPVL